MNTFLSHAGLTLSHLKMEAGRLGLMKTMRAIDETTKRLGEDIEAARKAYQDSVRRRAAAKAKRVKNSVRLPRRVR